MNRNRTSHQRVLISALHSFPWSLEGPMNATGFTINESAICPRFAFSHLGIKWKCKSTVSFFELQQLLRNQVHKISSTFVGRHYNTDHLEGNVIRLPPNWWPEGKWVTTEQWAWKHRLQLTKNQTPPTASLTLEQILVASQSMTLGCFWLSLPWKMGTQQSKCWRIKSR